MTNTADLATGPDPVREAVMESRMSGGDTPAVTGEVERTAQTVVSACAAAGLDDPVVDHDDGSLEISFKDGTSAWLLVIRPDGVLDGFVDTADGPGERFRARGPTGHDALVAWLAATRSTSARPPTGGPAGLLGRA